MRRVLFTVVFALLFFLVEFFSFNLIGRFCMPNFLLLLVIYCTLAFGIRYGILAAVTGGIFKDSFSTGSFGLHIFLLILCAYMTTVLKRYLHYTASRESRCLLAFLVVAIYSAASFGLHIMSAPFEIVQIFPFILVPEIFTTLMIASFTFTRLRQCALKLSV